METKHTNLPWNIMPSQRGTLLHIESDATAVKAGEPVCSIPKAREADAEFIVRACNAHDDLLEACKKANTCASLPDAVKEVIRAAIAKARGAK